MRYLTFRLLPILLTSAAGLFIACSSRVELKSAEHSTHEAGEKEMIQVAFSTKVESPTTQLRAEGTPELPPLATQKLTAVNNMRIVFYSEDERGEPTTVAYAFDRRFRIFRGIASGEDLKSYDFESGALSVRHTERITIGNYTVLFFLSPSSGLIAATQVGKQYDELSKPIPHDFAKEGDQSIIYSLYTNIHAPVRLREDQLMAGRHAGLLTLTTPSLKALTAMAYLRLDPQVADTDYYIPEGSNCIVYPDAQRSNFIPNASTTKITLDDQTVVELPQCDPYHGLPTTKQELLPYFTYYNPEVGRVNRHRFTIGSNEADSWIIPLSENTVAGSDVHTYTATRLVLMLPIIPKVIREDFEREKRSAGKAEDYGWLKVGDTYYTRSTFEAAYTAVQSKSSPMTQTEKIVLEAGKTLTAQARKINTSEVHSTTPLQFPKTNVQTAAVRYYDRGLSYKVLPIRHFKDDQVAKRNSDGRYAVVRNTLYLYQLSIGSIGNCVMDEYNQFLMIDSEVLPGDVSLEISRPSIVFTKQTL